MGPSSPARLPRTWPKGLSGWVRTPGTFSQMTNRGMYSLAISQNRVVSWPLGSDSPPRFPAWLKDWQGVPPIRMSMSCGIDQSGAVMSPALGMSGKCEWRTAEAYGSTSDEKTGFMPRLMAAHSGAPMPEQTDASCIRTASRTHSQRQVDFAGKSAGWVH